MSKINRNHEFIWFCVYRTVRCARNVASSFVFKKNKQKTQNALDLIDFKKDHTGIKSHFTSVKCPYKSRPLFLRKYNLKKER